MNFIEKCLILFCFLMVATGASQSNELDLLFEQKKYTEVIDKLQKKEQVIPLSKKDYFLLSKSYSNINKQDLSLSILNSLIPELVESGDAKELSVAYNLKAENLLDLLKVREGIDFCNNKLVEIEKNGLPFLQELCVKCGILYNEGKEYQKAYDVFQKITKKELKQTAIFINNYGYILTNNRKYDLALQYLKKGIDVGYKANNLGNLSLNLTNIAKILIKKEAWPEAKKYLDSAYVSLNEKSIALDKKEWYAANYEYYVRQHKLEAALRVIENIKDYNEHIYTLKTQEKINELSAINKRKTVLGKKVTLINNEIQSAKRRKFIWFIVLGCFIILMTSLFFIRIYRNIRLKYLKVVKTQEILASQMTPHFIFNSLSILQGMVLNNEHQKASEYLLKFSNLVNFIIQDELLPEKMWF